MNLGNGRGFSVKEIISEVEKNFSIKMPKQKAPARKGEYAEIYADPRKAKKILRWKSKKSLKDSVESLRRWYEKRPKGYEK